MSGVFGVPGRGFFKKLVLHLHILTSIPMFNAVPFPAAGSCHDNVVLTLLMAAA